MDENKIKEIFGDEVSYTDTLPEETTFDEEQFIKERIIINYLRLASKERKEMLTSSVRIGIIVPTLPVNKFWNDLSKPDFFWTLTGLFE